jgi:hypothetical protein
MRAASVVVVMALVGAVAGCLLVTGGSDGYSTADGGTVTGEGCQKPADCSGGACCFVPDAAVPTTVCQKSCPAWQQLCGVGSDCGDGGECLAQSCTVEGTTVQVTTCGAISFCTQ